MPSPLSQETIGEASVSEAPTRTVALGVSTLRWAMMEATGGFKVIDR